LVALKSAAATPELSDEVEPVVAFEEAAVEEGEDFEEVEEAFVEDATLDDDAGGLHDRRRLILRSSDDLGVRWGSRELSWWCLWAR
jgi:hypothetical protein